MQIHILDLQGFEANIEVEPDTPLKYILDKVSSDYQYDISNLSVFHFGALLRQEDKITSELLKDDNILVLLNQNVFKPKSYSSVDYSYHFQSSRFKEYFSEAKNVDSLCPKLNETEKKPKNNDDCYETSFYNKIQNMIDPKHAISPSEEKPNNTENTSDLQMPAAFHDLLNHYTPDQRESLRRLVSQFHDIRFVADVFENCDRDEEAAFATLSELLI